MNIKPTRLVWTVIFLGIFIVISIVFGIGWGQMLVGLFMIGLLSYEIIFLRKRKHAFGPLFTLSVWTAIGIVYGSEKTLFPDLKKITSSMFWVIGVLLFMFFQFRKIMKLEDPFKG